ncbi:Sec23/Sec24 family protein [Schizosaccharomyces japonicus yFS275]|uniref:Sec23/Sec24 family protein n=1 Tax=Schizosaccharomyces japonicus (strain yFS275 / FY16936) TaxID=402676 RepID=B6K7Y0_SCHJY|nr:Sec23/Sec24 family protein [Schizosaccharomyces japonicus yFS275]EEB09634.1 Sec23/Sec24 family protein [Schizosaccharomyces japonicus yFS275]
MIQDDGNELVVKNSRNHSDNTVNVHPSDFIEFEGSNSVSSSSSDVVELGDVVSSIVIQRLQNWCFYKDNPWNSKLYYDLPSSLTCYQNNDVSHVSPNYFRSTFRRVPKVFADCPSSLPFSMICEPFNGQKNCNNYSVAQLREGEIMLGRCQSCEGYINSSCPFVENGSAWICSFCSKLNKNTFAQSNYQQAFESASGTGTASIDITVSIAPEDYEFRVIFIIDTSFASFENGYAQTVLNGISEMILNPDFSLKYENTKIAFMTLDSCINMYQRQGNSFTKLIIPDLDDPLIPYHKAVFLDLVKDKDAILNVLVHIGREKGLSSDASLSLKAGLFVAQELLAPFGGKIVLASLYSALRRRDNGVKFLLESSVESVSGVSYWSKFKSLSPLGFDFLKKGIVFDLFVLCQELKFCDLSYEQMCFMTGGENNFYLTKHEAACSFSADLIKTFLSFEGFCALYSFYAPSGYRTSKVLNGISPEKEETNEFLIGGVSSHTCIALELQQVKAINLPYACFQFAIYYTAIDGSLHLRCHNYDALFAKNKLEVFSFADCEAIITFIAKDTLSRSLYSTATKLEKRIQKQCISAMVEYANAVQANGNPQKDWFSPNLKTFPYYMFALKKSPIVSSILDFGNFRSCFNQKIRTNGITYICLFLYPLLFPLHTLNFQEGFFDNQNTFNFPQLLPASRKNIQTDGCYLCFTYGKVYILLQENASTAVTKLLCPGYLHNENTGGTEVMCEQPSRLFIQIANICSQLSAITSINFNTAEHIRKNVDQVEYKLFESALIDDEANGKESYETFLLNIKNTAQGKLQHNGIIPHINIRKVTDAFHTIRFQKRDEFIMLP